MSDERSGEGPPPPSPLTGAYLLVVLPQLHSPGHKDRLIHALTKGLITWDAEDCHVDLDKELQNITAQSPEGEEAKNGERLIQFASENLVTEVLIHPQLNTLVQCMRNCLSSFTRHRHVVHAGYTSTGNGAWVLQDGTYSFSDFADMYSEHEVQRVLRAYEGTVSVDMHCSGEGDWWPLKAKDPFSKVSRVRLNPPDKTPASPAVKDFLSYLGKYLVPAGLEEILEASDVVGNIRFSHPTLYVFPGGQGDAALFGINGFNMLVDGGFSRKACFWDFTRHLDRLDSVLMTRINNGNLQGLASLFRRKRSDQVYPQIGHFFSNIPDRRQVLSPDGDKDRDPLLINLIEEGQEMLSGLRHLGLKPQSCYREPSVEPINLYHKVGHGKLDMYVLSPAKDSREVREFLAKWAAVDSKIFCSYSRKGEFTFPLSSKASICALLVWQPANPEDNITRILFPGSTPQQKIFEGLDRLKNLEFMKHPVCSAKSLSPSSSTVRLSIKGAPQPPLKSTLIEKVSESEKKQTETVKAVKQVGDVKKSTLPPKPKTKVDRPKEKPKTDLDTKQETVKIDKKTTEAVQKVDKEMKKEKPKKTVQKPPEKKIQKPSEKKSDSVKSSPTTPKKTVDSNVTETSKTETKPRASRARASPSATPAKSAKEANNRKVVELKSKETTKLQAQKSQPPKKDEPRKVEKPVTKKPTVSPKGVKSLSPVKAARPGVREKLDVKKAGKPEKEIATDSSAVSTPSTVDAELTKAKEDGKAKDVNNQEEPEISRKESEDRGKSISKEDDEEILIIEKVEISNEVTGKNDVETIELHLQKADDKKKTAVEITEETKVSSPTKDKEEKEDHELIPEPQQVAQEEVQEIIETATEIVTKKLDMQKTESQEISADKITTPKEKEIKSVDVDQKIDESQPDEKFSTTVESGATTTAPTLPEDERIPLDEIKEGVEEKHVKEETKEKEVIMAPRPEQLASIPQVPVIAGTVFDQRAQLLKDIVKTPDEVADLPVHEEVDVGFYDGERKDELLSLPPGKKDKKEDTTEELKLFKDNLEKEDKSKDLKEDMVESVDVLSHTTTDLDLVSSSPKSGKPLESDEKEEDEIKDDAVGHVKPEIENDEKPEEKEMSMEDGEKKDVPEKKSPELKETQEEIKLEISKDIGEKEIITTIKSEKVDELTTEKQDDEELKESISKLPEPSDEEIKDDGKSLISKSNLEQVVTTKEESEKEKISTDEKDVVEESSDAKSTIEKTEEQIIPDITKQEDELTSAEVDVGEKERKSQSPVKDDVADKDASLKAKSREVTPEPADATEDTKLSPKEKSREISPEPTEETIKLSSKEEPRESSPEPAEAKVEETKLYPKEKSGEVTSVPAEIMKEVVKLSRETTPEPTETVEESSKQSLKDKSREVTPEPAETTIPSSKEKSRELTPEPYEAKEKTVDLSPKEKSGEITPEPSKAVDEAIKLSPKEISREITPEPAEEMLESMKLSPKEKSREITPEPTEGKDDAKLSQKEKSRDNTPEPSDVKVDTMKLSPKEKSREITPEPVDTKEEATKQSSKDTSRDTTPEPAHTKEEVVKLSPKEISREVTPEPVDTKEEATLSPKEKSREITPEPIDTKDEVTKLSPKEKSQDITPETQDTKAEESKLSPKEKSEKTPEPLETKEEAMKLSPKEPEISPEPMESKKEELLSPKDKTQEILPETTQIKEESKLFSPKEQSREITPEPTDFKKDDIKLSSKEKSREITPEPLEAKDEAKLSSPIEKSREITPEPLEAKDEAKLLSPKEKSRDITPEPLEAKDEVKLSSPKEKSREITPEPLDAKDEAKLSSPKEKSSEITPEPLEAKDEAKLSSPKEKPREITPEPVESKDEAKLSSPKEKSREITPEPLEAKDEVKLSSPKEKSSEITPEPVEAKDEAKLSSPKEKSREITPEPVEAKEEAKLLLPKDKSSEITPEPLEAKDEAKLSSPKEKSREITPEPVEAKDEVKLSSPKEKSIEITPEPVEAKDEVKLTSPKEKSREMTPEPLEAKDETKLSSPKEKSSEITPEPVETKDEAKLSSPKEKSREITPEPLEAKDEAKLSSPKEKSREITPEPVDHKEDLKLTIKEESREPEEVVPSKKELSREITPEPTESKDSVKSKDIELEDADDVSFVEKQDLEEGELKEAKYINGFVKEELEAEEESEIAEKISESPIKTMGIHDEDRKDLALIDKTSKDEKECKVEKDSISLIDGQEGKSEQVTKVSSAEESNLEDIPTDPLKITEVGQKDDIKSELERSIKLEVEETAEEIVVADEMKVEQVAKEVKEDHTVVSVAEKVETHVESSEVIKEKAKATLTDESVELETKEICNVIAKETSVEKSDSSQLKEPKEPADKKDVVDSKPSEEIITINGFHKDDLETKLDTQEDVEDNQKMKLVSKPGVAEELISVSHDLGVLEDSKSPESSTVDQKVIKEDTIEPAQKQSPISSIIEHTQEIRDSKETSIIDLKETITSVIDEKAGLQEGSQKESEILVASSESQFVIPEGVDILKTKEAKTEKDKIISEIEDISKGKGEESGEKDSGIYLEKESDSKEIVKEEIIKSVSLGKDTVELKQEQQTETIGKLLANEIITKEPESLISDIIPTGETISDFETEMREVERQFEKLDKEADLRSSSQEADPLGDKTETPVDLKLTKKEDVDITYKSAEDEIQQIGKSDKKETPDTLKDKNMVDSSKEDIDEKTVKPQPDKICKGEESVIDEKTLVDETLVKESHETVSQVSIAQEESTENVLKLDEKISIEKIGVVKEVKIDTAADIIENKIKPTEAEKQDFDEKEIKHDTEVGVTDETDTKTKSEVHLEESKDKSNVLEIQTETDLKVPKSADDTQTVKSAKSEDTEIHEEPTLVKGKEVSEFNILDDLDTGDKDPIGEGSVYQEESKEFITVDTTDSSKPKDVTIQNIVEQEEKLQDTQITIMDEVNNDKKSEIKIEKLEPEIGVISIHEPIKIQSKEETDHKIVPVEEKKESEITMEEKSEERKDADKPKDEKISIDLKEKEVKADIEEKEKIEEKDTDPKSDEAKIETKEVDSDLKVENEKQEEDSKTKEEKKSTAEKVGEKKEVESKLLTEKTEDGIDIGTEGNELAKDTVPKEDVKGTELKSIQEKEVPDKTTKEIIKEETKGTFGKTEEKQSEEIKDGETIDKVKPEEITFESKILQDEAELKISDEVDDKEGTKYSKTEKVSEHEEVINEKLEDQKDINAIVQEEKVDSKTDQETNEKSEIKIEDKESETTICAMKMPLDDSKELSKPSSSESKEDKISDEKIEETSKKEENEGKSEQNKIEKEVEIKDADKKSKVVSDIEEKTDVSISNVITTEMPLSEEKVEETKPSLKQEQAVDSLTKESLSELKDSTKTEAEKQKVEKTTEGSQIVSDSPEKVEKGSIDSSIKEDKTDKGDSLGTDITSIEKEITSVISSKTETVEIIQSTSSKILDAQPESLSTSVLTTINGFAEKQTDDLSGKKEFETKLEETSVIASTVETSIAQETIFSSAKGEKDNVNEDLKSKMKDDKPTASTEDSLTIATEISKDSGSSVSQETSIEKKVLEIKDEVKELSSSIEKTLTEVKDEVKEISSSIEKGILGVKEGVKEIPIGIEKSVSSIKDIPHVSSGVEKETINLKEDIKAVTTIIEKELVSKDDIKTISSTITNGKKEEIISVKASDISSEKSLAEGSIYSEVSQVSNGKVEKDLPETLKPTESKSSVDQDSSVATVITTKTVTKKEITSEVKPSEDKTNGFRKSEEYTEKTETTHFTEISKPDQIESIAQSAKDVSEKSGTCIVEKITTEKQEIDGVKDVSVLKSTLEISPSINGSSTQESSKSSEFTKEAVTSSDKKDSNVVIQSSETIKTEETKVSTDLDEHITDGGSCITKTVTTTKETVSSSSSPKLSERKSDTPSQGAALTDLSMIKDMTASFISTEKWTGRTIETPEGRISPSSEASAVWRESDDDLPASPLSTTSHLHSPPRAMFSSVYGQRFEDDDSDVDFETAVREHAEVRGQSFTAKEPARLPPLDPKEPSFQMPLTPRPPPTDQPFEPKQLPFTSQPFEQKLPTTTTQISDTKQPIAGQPLDPLKPPLGLSLPPKTEPDGQKPVTSKDPIEKWDKPLGLPPPPSGKDYWSPFKEWGRPLHLPSPAPPPPENDTEDTSGSAKTTPKKVAKMNEENNRYASNIIMGKEANNKNRRSDSPVKKSVRDGKKSGMSHIYLDLSYVPHHGNSHYANVEFFKKVRARYYVFSGTEPSKDVFNALLEAKQTWEDKDLEVTIIPTYDTDTLGYWIAENEETLSKYKIDLSPSASRCTINLQDHDTSCSAYRLEF